MKLLLKKKINSLCAISSKILIQIEDQLRQQIVATVKASGTVLYRYRDVCTKKYQFLP
jgi:hypothetical protein